MENWLCSNNQQCRIISKNQKNADPKAEFPDEEGQQKGEFYGWLLEECRQG